MLLTSTESSLESLQISEETLQSESSPNASLENDESNRPNLEEKFSTVSKTKIESEEKPSLDSRIYEYVDGKVQPGEEKYFVDRLKLINQFSCVYFAWKFLDKKKKWLIEMYDHRNEQKSKSKSKLKRQKAACIHKAIEKTLHMRPSTKHRFGVDLMVNELNTKVKQVRWQGKYFEEWDAFFNTVESSAASIVLIKEDMKWKWITLINNPDLSFLLCLDSKSPMTWFIPKMDKNVLQHFLVWVGCNPASNSFNLIYCDKI